MNTNLFPVALLIFLLFGCGGADGGVTDTKDNNPNQQPADSNPPLLNTDASIIFLHHSTGGVIWGGGGGLENWITAYNAEKGANYKISQRAYPKELPYGWNNYPYDYWNIWVNHASESQYQTEDTLEILTRNYNVIIWKHCFPSSDIQPDSGVPDVSSSVKTIANYKLQYAALKQKMHEFPKNIFIVWTGAALVQSQTNEAKATRAREFFQWVKNNWDEPNDNIFVWDFYELETAGGIYLAEQNASSATDSHPSAPFAARVMPYLGRRIVNIMEGRGDTTNLTGE